MLLALIFTLLSSSGETTLRLRYGPVVTPIVGTYAKCVAEHTPSPSREGVKVAFEACRSIRRSALERAEDGKQRSKIGAALSDYETHYLRFTLDSTDAP